MPPHLVMTSTETSTVGPDPLLLPPNVNSQVKYVSSKSRQDEKSGAGGQLRQLRREHRSLSRAITGLEELMQEALTVAYNAAMNGRAEDVTNVLNSTCTALNEAKAAIPSKQQVSQGTTTQPLCVSDDSASRGSSSETKDLTTEPPSVSIETVPTVLTRSIKPNAQPVAIEGVTISDRRRLYKQAESRLSASEPSFSHTPPRLYQPESVESIVRDFAYTGHKLTRAKAKRLSEARASYGAAAEFYGDHGESVATQPGVRHSVVTNTDPRALRSEEITRSSPTTYLRPRNGPAGSETPPPLSANPNISSRAQQPERRRKEKYKPHVSEFFEPAYYRIPDPRHPANQVDPKPSSAANSPGGTAPPIPPPRRGTTDGDGEPAVKLSSRQHISLREGQGFSLGRYHRRQPIAREWHTARKRITAAIACSNTVFIGLIAGIYAGEVPRIQYQIQDINQRVILGNVVLFCGLGLSTVIFWPLPLLHGRKPYTLLAFACMLPLQFPQALAIDVLRNPNNALYRCGLLIPRAFTGFAMGFANINQLPTLFDLFGCSLMSEVPHQEVVMPDDVRRHGGGVGIWLGIWTFCFVGSLSIGFCIGACIISRLNPSWGFYVVMIMLAVVLAVNVIAPETRRAPYRRSIAHFFDQDDPEKLKRRVARGEVKLHISNDGPKWWWQEVFAGLILSKRMMTQPGFFVLAWYIAWIYAQTTLVILLLGALLSRNYAWRPQYVGLSVLSLALGALLGLPLSKASIFSRARWRPQRTDSMTMHQAHRITWSSHLIRRCTFTFALPFAALGYTLTSPGPSVNWTAPTLFCALVGFLSHLAVAECVGLIMETFDTCDLQPGVNSRHRLQSLAETTRRRRTNYSSFPRVCAGFFAAQSLGFFLAAAATAVSGELTRALGAQIAIASVAAILLVVTALFCAVMVRFRQVQVIPDGVFDRAWRMSRDGKEGSLAFGAGGAALGDGGGNGGDTDWKAVVIGNPSGKMRRVNCLELGSQSRWSEIRKLNKLMK